jgi:hypothetical protein
VILDHSAELAGIVALENIIRGPARTANCLLTRSPAVPTHPRLTAARVSHRGVIKRPYGPEPGPATPARHPLEDQRPGGSLFNRRELDTFRPALTESLTRELSECSRHACGCCGCLTLLNVSSYEICPGCGWEDDRADTHRRRGEPDAPSGPNRISLTQARANFAAFGASLERRSMFVRDPDRRSALRGGETNPLPLRGEAVAPPRALEKPPTSCRPAYLNWAPCQVLGRGVVAFGGVLVGSVDARAYLGPRPGLGR